MTTGQLARAEIVNLDTNASIRCMFNPKEYTFTKSNTWTEQAQKGMNAPALEFGGGAAGTLSLELLFDTYEAHPWFKNRAGEDVRKYTKDLWGLMAVNEKKKDPKTGRGEPPRCKFQWGSLWSFEAVITQISQTFTLFMPNGTPVRAKLSISFKQVKDEGQYPRQNPSSGGNPGEHMYTICEGDTLPRIAYEIYGDSTVWRHLADTNNIVDPRRLRAGRQLIITPLPPH